MAPPATPVPEPVQAAGAEMLPVPKLIETPTVPSPISEPLQPMSEPAVTSAPQPAPKGVETVTNKLLVKKRTPKRQMTKVIAPEVVEPRAEVKQEPVTGSVEGSVTKLSPAVSDSSVTATSSVASLEQKQEPVSVPLTLPSFSAGYLNNPAPRYPPAARRLGLQGTVVLRVWVNTEGKPEQVEIAQSSGAEPLDEAAINAVREWSFVPARQGDKAVTAAVDVPVRFRLN